MLWAALARSSAFLNLLNLIPVAILDGGHAGQALSKAERLFLMGACVALWLALDQGLFIAVAVGFAYQTFFAGDFPSHPSRKTTVYFFAVLAALGILLHGLPAHNLVGR